MELLVVLVIILIFLGVTLQGLVAQTVALVGEARSLTLFSKDATVYGVHFSNASVTRFTGPVYTPSDPDNVVVPLPSYVVIGDITLAGGGSDVVFHRLTGETDMFGSVTFELSADAARTETITISETGLVEVE
jgi:hypothetical protein